MTRDEWLALLESLQYMEALVRSQDLTPVMKRILKEINLIRQQVQSKVGQT